MADSILRLKVESQEYDNKLKQATNGLTRYVDECRKVGGTLEVVEKETLDYVRAIGQMDTTSRTATGKLAEMKKTFVELSAQYNQISDAEKNSPFGKALAASLDQLKPRINEFKQQLDDIHMSLSGSAVSAGGGLFSGLGDKMSGALQVFGGNVMTKIAGMGVGLANEMADAVKQGIELARQGEGIRIAFERLGRGDILDGLREATHGTVTDLELMKAAVKFNDFKLPLDELGLLLAFAQQKAKDTGQSVDYMVDSIVTGLGRKSLMILDNLGLSANEVKEKMKETGDMTKAVGEIIREQMSKAGDYVETAADRAAQAHVSLQNKMEELGRKFSPLQEASNNFWTSMKIGILDIVGGPLTRLLNGLTEAGRLQNMLRNMNGEPGSGNTKVDQQLKKLNVIKKAGGSDYIFNSTLNGMMEDYNRQIAALDAKIKDTKNLSPEQQASKFVRDEVQKMSEQMKALGIMRDQLAAGAKDMNKPVKVETATTDTTNPTTNTPKTSGTTKLNPIQQASVDVQKAEKDYAEAINNAQQKLVENMMKSDDYDKQVLDGQKKLSDAYLKAYNATGDDKYLNSFRETAQHINEMQGVVDKNIEAQKQVEQAAREHAAAQKKLSEAHIRLSEAQKGGNLKEIYAAEKKVISAQQEVKRLETIKVNVETGTVDLPDIPKEIEQVVSTKVGEVLTPDIATDIVQTINTRLGSIVKPEIAEQLTQTINTKIGDVVTPDIAEELTQVVNIVPGTVNLPDIPKEQEVKIVANTDNISAEIAHLKEKLGSLEIGSLDFNKTQANIVDMTTLQTIINEQMKNELNIDSAVTHNMFSRIINGFDIDDNEWQGVVNKINEKLKDMKLEPLKIDFQTGKIAKDGKVIKSSYKDAASAVNSLGSALSGLDDPAAKIAGVIAQSIANVALAFSSAQLKDGETGNVWYWISAIAAGTAAMISTIATIHSATGFQNGGMIKGYSTGGTIQGNSYSGDRIGGLVDGSQLIGLNAGEVVLNKAQQATLAQNLQNGGGNIRMTGEVTGEKIVLVANRYLKRTGQGEIVTW